MENIEITKEEWYEGTREDLDLYQSYNLAKKSLFPRLVNAEREQQLLSMTSHNYICDLGIIYQIVVSVDEEKETSILVTDELLDIWGVTLEEVHRQALENMRDDYIVDLDEMSSLLVISHPDGCGASFMADTVMLNQLTERIGDDIYIIPASQNTILIAETSLFMKENNIEKIEQLLEGIGTEHEEVFLSKYVYRFSRGDEEISRVINVFVN